ncbi:MAG: sugar phosphate nucleotidyltransferase, partial [Anaerolineaceae bacterium]
QKITIAIPMAGYGTRMRPHTWSKPKPLVPIAGRTVLDYVLEQFSSLPSDWQVEYVFIISPNGWDIRTHMESNYPDTTVRYVVQEEMHGQSHALYLAKEFLNGPMLMTFSDTLIETDLAFLKEEPADGVAWVKQVPDPRRFGVAEVGEIGNVTRLVEKPQDMNNNMAVVGFYYFKSAEALMSAIETQMQQNIKLKNEFFLVDAINILLEQGQHFRIEEVETWLDAGIPDAVLETNRYLLEHNPAQTDMPDHPWVSIIPPVYIHPQAEIKASVIGPHVSIGAGCQIHDAIIRDSILDDGCTVKSVLMEHSLVGKHVKLKGKASKWNLGDNTEWETE